MQTADDLAAQIPHGSDDAERQQFAEIFLDYVKSAEPKVRERFDDGARSVDDLRPFGLPGEEIFEPVVDRLLGNLKLQEASEKRSSNRYGLTPIDLPVTLPPDVVGRAATSQRWSTLLRDIELTESRIADFEARRESGLQRLAAVTPTGVLGALLALAGVVIAGIAFPVVVLAMRWPDLTAPWRWTLVGAFLLSVAAVGLYIFRLADGLASGLPRKDGEAPSSS